jgi:hypothetical protein
MPTETKKKKKPRFESAISVGAGSMDTDSLRTMATRDPADFIEKCQDLIDTGQLRWDQVRSLPRLVNALIDVKVPMRVQMLGETRAITASAFPALTGLLTIAGVNEAYEAVPTIGELLVTDVESNKKVSEHVLLTTEDTAIDRVDETYDFPEVGAGEETFEIRHLRNGRKMTISAEAVEENDVGNITERVNKIGEIAGELIEEQTLSRVTDHNGSASSAAEPFALRQNKAGAALYSSTANTPGTRVPSGTRITNNALVNTTDLDNARARLAAALNTRGKRQSIPINQTTLLVPDALMGVALKTTNSELEPGVENETNNWGPRGRYRPRLLSSPKLDDLSTSAWYLGWFEKQFKRKWKLRLEFVSLFMDAQKFLDSRIAAQFRVAWDVEVGAVDYVFVYQNLSGTTAPFDE